MGDRDRYQSYWDRDENRFRDDQSRNRTDEWRSRDRDSSGSRDYGRDYNRDYGRDNTGAGRSDYNRDYSRDYGRDTERQYGYQYPERNYGQSFSGYESKRFPATFGSSEDQRYGREWNRDRFDESERSGSPYGAGRESRNPGDFRTSDWSPYRDRYRQESTNRGYERDSGNREHSESFGHQLREAGQRFVGKVKRAFRGPKGYKRSDERIREDVNDRLSMQDDLDPSEIEVAVSNGEVTLTGSVMSRHEKFLAEEIADDVSGVTDVHNQLRVARAQTSQGAYNETSSTYGQTATQTGTQAGTQVGGTEANRGRNARTA